MALYDIRTLIDAITTTLSAAASLVRTESYDEITEGIHDTPLLQVYMEENAGTDYSTATDRITLSGKHSLKEYLVYADVYANQRANIGEDMARLYETVNEVEDILDNQGCMPFNQDYVTSMRWSWRRVVFDYAGVDYVGARFSITVRCGSDT